MYNGIRDIALACLCMKIIVVSSYGKRGMEVEVTDDDK